MVDLLLVEDDESSRLAIVEYLSTNGFALHAVSGGREALAAARRQPPRMLLCDWLLPDGMRGIEVARALRGSIPDLAVVFISGLPEEELQRQLGDLTISGMLTKPVSLEDIQSTVTATLQHPGLSDTG